MEENKINKKITISIVSILLVVMVIIGATFAYFMAQESTDEQTITTGTLSMNFTHGNIVRATGLTPINDNEIKTSATELPFSVTNTGNKHMKLTIKLVDLTLPPELKNINFRWGLYNADTDVGVSFGTFTHTDTEQIILQDVVLDSGSSAKNYVLRVWAHENGGIQNDMMGKEFKAKVQVTGQAVEYTPESCFVFDESYGKILAYDVQTDASGNIVFDDEGYEIPLNKCPKDVVIPKTINGKTVTSIGSIPNDIKGVNMAAFANKGLTSVSIPDTVTAAEESAFSGNSLTHVTIPESFTYIDLYSFSLNDLTSVSIPESIGTIYQGAFHNNELHTIVTSATWIESGFINNNITDAIIMETNSRGEIYDGAFKNNQITTFELPKNFTIVYSGALSNNPNLTEVIVRGKSGLADFDVETGLTTAGGLPEGVTITFVPYL